MRMYTLNEVSNKLTLASPTRIFTTKRIWDWCQKEGLCYESMPSGIKGVSYKPVWIREDELVRFLRMKGFDTEQLFMPTA